MPVRRTNLLRRYGASGLGIALCIMLGVLAGVGAFTVHAAKGLSYLSNDPAACVNCHIMRDEYNAWQKSSHHTAATCNDCHVPHELVGKYLAKAEHGWNHSKAFTLQDFHEPIQIKEKSLRDVQENCIRCHGDFVSEITRGHGSHAQLEDVFNCVRCHWDVGHGAAHE